MNYVGQIISNDLYLSEVQLATKGAVMTYEMQALLRKFGMDVPPITALSREMADFCENRELRPTQIKALRHQSFNIQATVIRERISHIILDKHIALYFNQIQDVSEYESLHALNVALLSGLIAVHLKLVPEAFDEILIGALLHDIGKICGLQEYITKNSRLTDEEFKLVREHPTLGERVLHNHFHTTVLQIALMHHECEDGSGYPLGRKKIPLAPAIVHVADVFDAMSRQRDYKNPFDRFQVRDYILSNVNGIFNPIVIDAFRKCIGGFFPGESFVVAGIPATVVNYKNGEYELYVEGIETVLKIDEEALRKKIAWPMSIER